MPRNTHITEKTISALAKAGEGKGNTTSAMWRMSQTPMVTSDRGPHAHLSRSPSLDTRAV